MTIVVVRLSKTADMKKVISPTTHINPLFLFDVIISVTTLKPEGGEKGERWKRNRTREKKKRKKE